MRRISLALGALVVAVLFCNDAPLQAQKKGGSGPRVGGGPPAGAPRMGGAPRVAGAPAGGPRVAGAPYRGVYSGGAYYRGGYHPGRYPYYGNRNNFWWGVGVGTALGYGLGGWGYGYPAYSYYPSYAYAPYSYSVPSYSYYSVPPSYYYDAPPLYMPPADVAPSIRPAASASLNVEVRVPSPDAQVWINGQLSTRTGLTRWFTVTDIYPDRPYQYEVRATWMEDGRPVTQTRTVTVRAGETAQVVFGGG